MKATDTSFVNQTKTTANFWPTHPPGTSGPWDLRLSIKHLPPMIQRVSSSSRVAVSIEQPNEDNNFTMIRVLWKSRVNDPSPALADELRFHWGKFYRKGNGVCLVRVRGRLLRRLPHPLPTGQYVGTIAHGTANNLFTLLNVQKMTLEKQTEAISPEAQKHTIITPGDPEYGDTLIQAEKALLGDHELGS